MKTTWMLLAACLAVLAISACSSKKTYQGGLAVSARSSAATAAAGSAGLTLPDGITISRIRMAVQRIKVEGDDPENACSTTSPTPMASRNGGSGGSDDGSGHSGSDDGRDDEECDHLAFGPFDVDLAGSALSGAVSFAFNAPIPAGTFEEIEIKVNTVPASAAGDNQVLKDLAAAHASILVDGFVEDAPTTLRPFTFSTPLEVTQKREGKIVVGPGANVTLDFDPSHWFDGPSGRLDPEDPTAQGQILANIRASIRILKDDDHDGRDDDDEGHDGAGHH
jgi:hypothetical protein